VTLDTANVNSHRLARTDFASVDDMQLDLVAVLRLKRLDNGRQRTGSETAARSATCTSPSSGILTSLAFKLLAPLVQ